MTPSQPERWIAVGGLVAVVVGLSVGLVLALRPGEKPRHVGSVTLDPIKPSAVTTKEPPPEYFANQPNPPELVIMVSGQMYGYLQPCGCARPQVGGLERRYELLQELKKKDWLVSAADLGDVAPKANDPARLVRAQGRVQYETAIHILKKLEVAAVGLGSTELELPVDQALGHAQNYQPPFLLAANLVPKDAAEADQLRAWFLDEPGERASPKRPGMRVGYVSVISASVAEKAKHKDATLVIEPAEPALRKSIEEIEEQKPDLLVLLFQGTRAEARELAPKFPQFRVILTRDDSDEPSALPERLGQQMLIATGFKGKNIGLVGVFPADGEKRFDLKYQLVTLTEHFELPDDKTNDVRELMKEYVLRVQRDNFLAAWPRSLHPMQLDFPEARYVGAAACKECHPKAHAIWSNSKHSHAYENLAKYGRPVGVRERKGQELQLIGRQFDPECARCHTTGFEYRTGFENEKKSPHLFGNQCENCHGPASLHVADAKNLKYSQPLRLKIDAFENQCRRCHDTDNDPKFDLNKYWPQIRHPRD
jgi:hypothetical protein